MSREDKQAHLEQVHRVLVIVAKKLNSAKVKWLLGASGSLMVQGVKIVPFDLDIFVAKGDVYVIADLLSKCIKTQFMSITTIPEVILSAGWKLKESKSKFAS